MVNNLKIKQFYKIVDLFSCRFFLYYLQLKNIPKQKLHKSLPAHIFFFINNIHLEIVRIMITAT